MGSGNKIIRNAGWLVYNKIFSLLMSLFVTVKIVNHFGSEDYGAYAYAVSVVAILETIVTFAEPRVTKKKYLNYDPAFVVYNSMIARGLLSIVALVIGVVFMIIYRGTLQFNRMFVVLLMNNIITNLSFGIETCFEYNLKSKNIVIQLNIIALLTAVLQIIAVYFKLDILSLCYIGTISSIVGFISIYIQYRCEYHRVLRNQFDFRFVCSIIGESGPLAIAAAAATIYTKCDSVMIGNILGNSDVGVYAVGLKLFNIAKIAIVPVRTSLFPKQMELYHSDKKRYEQLYIATASCMTWLCVIGIVLSYIMLPPIFVVFFSIEYRGALGVFNISAIGLIFMYNAVLRTGHYSITNDGKIMMYTQLTCAVLNIILNAFLIPLWGINGAAVATVATNVVSLMLSNFFFDGGKEIFFWQIKAFNPKYLVDIAAYLFRK